MGRRVMIEGEWLWGRSEILLDRGSVVGYFGELFGEVEGDRSLRSLVWYRGVALSHLERDYGGSWVCEEFGIELGRSYCVGHVYMDGEFGLDLLVESCIGGMSRNELMSWDREQYPSPAEIAFRKGFLVGSQRGEWVGVEPAYGLREYFLGELDGC